MSSLPALTYRFEQQQYSSGPPYTTRLRPLGRSWRSCNPKESVSFISNIPMNSHMLDTKSLYLKHGLLTACQTQVPQPFEQGFAVGLVLASPLPRVSDQRCYIYLIRYQLLAAYTDFILDTGSNLQVSYLDFRQVGEVNLYSHFCFGVITVLRTIREANVTREQRRGFPNSFEVGTLQNSLFKKLVIFLRNSDDSHRYLISG